jgi:hypothetical protein
MVVGPDANLGGEGEARWRFIAETDDEGEAWRLLGVLHGKILKGEA